MSQPPPTVADPTMPASLPRRRFWGVLLRLVPALVLCGLGALAWVGWRRAQPHLQATTILISRGADVTWSGDEDLLRFLALDIHKAVEA